jgi:hypothetical protein
VSADLGTGHRVVLLGVRHHGPGSARSVAAALAAVRPDRILIEGPADADELIPLVGEEAMLPPVALLAYREQDPKTSAFWPFAAFSPEWAALRYGVGHGVSTGFCDLPAAASLGMDRGAESEEEDEAGAEAAPGSEPDPEPEFEPEPRDPLTALAIAAGYEQTDDWWEDVVEHNAYNRSGAESPLAVFEAIAEAMAAVRDDRPIEQYDLIREAYMRSVLRKALDEGCERVAVVCGAYHVPAFFGLGDGRKSEPPTVRADKALLALVHKPTKATATALTWVPWTHSRLSYHSGYGAGIESPGWYRHLFESDDHVAERWLTKVAGLLRAERFAVSPAHLIEGTRLADTLAALRGRPAPGLAELAEATLAVLCEGHPEPLGLIGRELVVGEDLGEVPDGCPTVPLAADVTREARRLRVPKAAEEKEYDLDLRRPNDLDRSKLFHRLGLLGVDWAVNTGSRGAGTFRESWRVAWEPVFEVKLVEAAVWGTTVPAAAAAKALADGAEARTLGSLTVLVERCLTADLPQAVDTLVAMVKSRAAVEADITDLATALPPLAKVLRYGDVRSTSAGTLGPVVEGIALRIAIGLPRACVGIDDEAARAFAPSLAQVQEALRLLDDPVVQEPWDKALRQVADLDGANGLLAGRATRLLSDAGAFDSAAVGDRMARTLSRGAAPATAAGWLEGLLAGSGRLLVHDTAMLGLIDGWLAGLEAERFEEVLPLLRRTYSTFTGPERRAIGDRVPHLPRTTATSEHDDDTDTDTGAATDLDDAVSPVPAQWADAAVATVHLLLTGTGSGDDQ